MKLTGEVDDEENSEFLIFDLFSSETGSPYHQLLLFISIHAIQFVLTSPFNIVMLQMKSATIATEKLKTMHLKEH